MRTFIPTLLITLIFLIPSVLQAQDTSSVLPPSGAGSPPNVVPPTAPPTEPLPPTPLPNEAVAAPSAPGAEEPSAVSSESTVALPSTGNGLLVISLIGTAVLIVGIGWYLWRRKGAEL
ncbi:LPXTG cell wall anchor domain-containing protein [Candidatus Kaiserbacteria bacterium]|nr:LPXTG cell wall anchor domain-containing protein [Candidatus Kaiserbacteria bacterium]